MGPGEFVFERVRSCIADVVCIQADIDLLGSTGSGVVCHFFCLVEECCVVFVGRGGGEVERRKNVKWRLECKCVLSQQRVRRVWVQAACTWDVKYDVRTNGALGQG